jgi:hypothetical protein
MMNMGKGGKQKKLRPKQVPIQRAVSATLPVVDSATGGWKTWIRSHAPILGALAGVLSLIVAVGSYKLNERAQLQAKEQKTANIYYSFSIHPLPMNHKYSEDSNRWEVSMTLRNGGPATAQTLVLHLHCPDPSQFPHFEPVINSQPSVATVEVLSRRPPGYYQVVFRNLPSGDGSMIGIYFEAPASSNGELMKSWKNGMFSKEFARRFIQSFQFTGDNIDVKNEGMLELEPFGEE